MSAIRINDDPKNYKYSEVYGTLLPLTRRDYMRGPWVYVASEELDEDGILYDIVRNDAETDPLMAWRYTII